MSSFKEDALKGDIEARDKIIEDQMKALERAAEKATAIVERIDGLQARLEEIEQRSCSFCGHRGEARKPIRREAN